MNKQRRKELWAIQQRLFNIIDVDHETCNIEDVHSELADIKGDLMYLYNEEESYMDNMPENLQSSSRYYAAEDACDNIDSAMDSINDAIDCDDLDSLTDCIDSAISYIDDATV